MDFFLFLVRRIDKIFSLTTHKHLTTAQSVLTSPKKTSDLSGNQPHKVAARAVPSICLHDQGLRPYLERILSRIHAFDKLVKEIKNEAGSLEDFAAGHEYFGLHFLGNEWIFREWAPNASGIFFLGTMTNWEENSAFALKKLNERGIWELKLPEHALKHEDLYCLNIYWDGGHGRRIPAYARRVVQDEKSKIFNAQVWRPKEPHEWKHPNFRVPTPFVPLIYEVHIGMAQEDGKVGTYKEFRENILPRILDMGYNTLQLMAIMEHPYYGSFGYHVSNFFAASSRFGTPEELKELIDQAHSSGLAVIMDMIHSHSVRNEIEGLSSFDGSTFQYFHEGNRGHHIAWDSKCFNYQKKEVLHFLLSNCRYWLDEFKFDGFRFDGVTSMLYLDHGLGREFGSYKRYYDDGVDEDSITYLSLANTLIHNLRPDAITIGEDVSGFPGTTLKPEEGGIGFNFRLAMGIPDYWIKLIKDVKDDDWDINQLWYELNNKRAEEKTISYCESHDQALVGDQTLIFRLIGKSMYDSMRISDENLYVERGMALHKIIRLITLATASNGYLNFMGNEFGHPEWIDFPREGNNWSYHYARRQWSLRDHPSLRYGFLAEFDRVILKMVLTYSLLHASKGDLLFSNNHDKVLCFRRSNLIFIFNFNPSQSFTDYEIGVPTGKYRLVLNTDHQIFGGHSRIKSGQSYFSSIRKAKTEKFAHPQLKIYIPTRTALVLMAV